MLISSGEFIKVIDRIGSTMIVIPLDDVSVDIPLDGTSEE
jgi:hypothetical protein